MLANSVWGHVMQEKGTFISLNIGTLLFPLAQGLSFPHCTICPYLKCPQGACIRLLGKLTCIDDYI